MNEFEILTNIIDYDYSKVSMFDDYCTNPLTVENAALQKSTWLDDLGWL